MSRHHNRAILSEINQKNLNPAKKYISGKNGLVLKLNETSINTKVNVDDTVQSLHIKETLQDLSIVEVAKISEVSTLDVSEVDMSDMSDMSEVSDTSEANENDEEKIISKYNSKTAFKKLEKPKKKHQSNDIQS